MATEEHRVVIGVDYVGSQDVTRFLADLAKLGPAAEAQMRRLAQAFQNGQGQLQLDQPTRGPLALPAGTGTPRIDNRYVSRQRATEVAQDNYLRALNQRVDLMRQAADAERAQLRAVRFQDKVGEIAAARGGQLSFGPSGNVELAFTAAMSAASNQFRDLSTRLQRLNGRIAAAEAHFSGSNSRSQEREVRQFAETHNRAAIQALMGQMVGSQETVGSDVQADILNSILGTLRANTNVGRTLLHHGEASSTLLGQLTPEQRHMLVGSSEGPREYGATSTTGPRIPGLINLDKARSEIQGQRYGALYETQARVQQELNRVLESRVLENRRILAIETAQAQDARRAGALPYQGAAYPGVGRARIAAALRGDPYESAGYHGTIQPLPDRLHPASQIAEANGQAYGRALYTSSEPTYSHNYAVGSHFTQGDAGYLYQMQAPAGARRFNLDQNVSRADLDALVQRLKVIADTVSQPVSARDGAERAIRELEGHFANAGKFVPGESPAELEAIRKLFGDPTMPGRQGHTTPPMTYDSVYGHGRQAQEAMNEILRSRGYDATQAHGQTMWLNPETLRHSLAQRVSYADYVAGRGPVGQSLVPHASFGAGADVLPELQRALAAIRAEAQARLADQGAAYPGLGRGGRSGPAYAPAMQYFAVEGEAWARHPSGQVGAMMWDTRTGKIEMVEVIQQFRRLGVATGMLTAALEKGYNVVHSPERTEMGDAWARRVSGSNVPALARADGTPEFHPPILSSGLTRAYEGMQGWNRRYLPVPHASFGEGLNALPELERAIAARALVHVPGLGYGTSALGFGSAQASPFAQFASGHVTDLRTATQIANEANARVQREQAALAAGNGGAGFGNGNGRSGGGNGGPPPPPPLSPGHPGDDANNQNRRNKGTTDWFAANEALIDATRGETASAVLKAKANVKAAEVALQEMVAKGDKGVGVKGGYATDDARLKAQATATARLETAYAGLERAILREKEAELKAAAAAERRAAPNDLGVAHGPGMPLSQQTIADTNQGLLSRGALTPMQGAQQALAQAQGALAQATKNHAQVMGGTYQNQQQAATAYAGSLGALTNAQTQAKAAQQRITQMQQAAALNGPGGGGAGGGGRGGGFFSAFGAGFRGNPNVPVATQLGQTARFSVFYGTMYKALFAITQTFQQALQEGIQFEDAMTDLVIAAGKPRQELEGLAKTLGDQSVRAGFAPSQGVEIGARSLGLYGVAGNQGTLSQQEQVATVSARVVSQLAVGSKKDPVALQGDIAAIAQALGLGAGGQQRIADLDAYFTKRFGVQQGSTLETVAQSASVGKAAGFSDEQLFSIAADMISRTGQTPSAVAGFMAQIFSRGGEGSLVDVAAKQGIDPNQDLARIVGQLSEIYKTANPREQAQISAAFGRGKVQNAAVALLGDYSEVQSASADGRDKATGQADRQFQEHMANIGGQLREFGGMLRLFAQELGQSGLLDAIGAGVLVLKDLVQAGNTLLGLWIEMPRGMRDAILALTLLTVATRSAAAGALLNRAAAAGGLIRAAGPVTAAGAMAPFVTSTGQAATAGGAAFAVGKGLLRMIGPIGLAVGGLLALGSIKASTDRMRAAQEGAVATLLSGDLNPFTSTASDYRSQASELTAQAGANRQATGWFTNAVTFGLANNGSMATAARLSAEAKRLNRVADGIPEVDVPQTGAFRSLAAADVKSGIDSLTTSGATAQIQLKALRDVLYGTAGAAKAAADAFKPKDFAARAAGGIVAAGIKVGKGAHSEFSGGDFGDEVSKYLTGDVVETRLTDSLKANHVTSLADLDQDTATAVAKDVAAGIADKAFSKDFPPQVVKFLQGKLVKSIRDKLLLDGAGARQAASGTSALSGADATNLANTLVSASDARLGDLGETDHKGRITEVRQRIQDLRRTRRRTTDPNAIAGINQQISKARVTLVDEQLAEIDALRKVAYQNATTKAQINSAGHAALASSIAAIVKNGSSDQLVALVAAAGHGSILMAKQAIRDAIRIARASMLLGAEAAQLGNVIDGAMRGAGAAFRGEGAVKGNKDNNDLITRLQGMYSALSGATYGGGKDNKYTAKGSDVFNPNFPGGDASANPKDTPAEIAAAKAAALATQSGNPVAQAQAHMQSARAAMAKAKKNTVAWYDAQADLFTAQNEYNAALGAVGTSASALKASQTGSPVDAAKAQIVAARQAMVDAKGDQAAYNAALGSLYEGQRALAGSLAAIPGARATAGAARVGGGIASAKAGIISAHGAMKAAAGDQVAYFGALGQLYDSERALRDAVLAAQKNNMLLGVDMTNPLSTAHVDSRAAALKLAQDRRSGQAGDVLAQDKVDLRTARNNEESTRFSQRLQSVQTAEQLGRISHSKYINYLDSEHRRLESIKHRTFQQQQELDQIDGLMKDAATAMQGQWNFGDIKLPTGYQVRRYIESTAGAALQTSAGSTTHYQTVTLNVNGADTAKVTRIVQDVVGKGARTTTSKPRRV